MDFRQLDDNGIIYFPCNGKKPAIAKWSELVASKKGRGNCNYGILCGNASGLTVVDLDKKSGDGVQSGVEFWDELLDQYNEGDALRTPTVKTGTGGYHIYFKYNPAIKTGTQCVKGLDAQGYKIAYSIDIRSAGGYVVAAGSTHPDTKTTYKYEYDFKDCIPIDMPAWVLDALTKNVILNRDGKVGRFEDRHVQKHIDLPIVTEDAAHTPDELDLDTFRSIVLSLGKDRAHNYSDWTKVCWAVGAIDRKFGWDNMDALVEFSKKSTKFTNDIDVQQHYDEATGALGLGSLWYWLKEDDPSTFNIMYAKYKASNRLVYYFRDYTKLMVNYRANGYLTAVEVEEYLKSALVKVINGGNTRWLSRNRGECGEEWEMLKYTPFTDNKIHMKLMPAADEEGDEKHLKTSFYNILQQCSVYPDFPMYDRVDFRPYLRDSDKDYNDEDVFNLFTGFQHSPDGDVDESLIEPILHCMREVLSAGNEEFFNYYIRYLAHAVQYPNEKPGIAILFISPQGLGKDLINYDFLKHVFGSKLLHRVNDLSAITRNFNKKLEGKLFTIIGEIRSFCNDLDTEKLKGIITDITINIEPKGKDPYEIRDFQRFIAHTNNCVPVGISADDRRFVIHKIAPEYVQSRSYYDNLAKVIKNPDVAIHFFRYLAQMDLSNFNIRDKPTTAAKRELTIMTAPNTFRFMADVYTKTWMLQGALIKDDTIKIHTKSLYSNYTDWIVENGERNKLSLKSFKQKLEERGFCEHDSRLMHNRVKASGYKTTFTNIHECFEPYILAMQQDDADEEGLCIDSAPVAVDIDDYDDIDWSIEF